MFPWFTIHGIDGEVDAYAKFIHAIAMRALTSSRISSTERQTDNDKFTMRLFLNNLGFKGEEYKFARRFLVRNALTVQAQESFVSGPKKLNIPGAGSYLYPMFVRFGVITSSVK